VRSGRSIAGEDCLHRAPDRQYEKPRVLRPACRKPLFVRGRLHNAGTTGAARRSSWCHLKHRSSALGSMSTILRKPTGGWRCAEFAERRRKARGGSSTSRMNDAWPARRNGWTPSRERDTWITSESRSRSRTRRELGILSVLFLLTRSGGHCPASTARSDRARLRSGHDLPRRRPSWGTWDELLFLRGR